MLKKDELQRKINKINNSGLYDCYICFNRLHRPSTCFSCHKTLCGTHIEKLRNRCPNCRAHPFRFSTDPILDSFLKELSREEWETLNKNDIHSCRIEGCQFEGNYVSMLKHRKRGHPTLSIQDVMTGENVSEESRKAAMLRGMIKKLIAYKMMELTLTAVTNALTPNNSSEKKKHPSLMQAKQMAHHVANCTSLECRRMWNTKWGSYIGRGEGAEEEFHLSECDEGRQLNVGLGWKYHDPKH